MYRCTVLNPLLFDSSAQGPTRHCLVTSISAFARSVPVYPRTPAASSSLTYSSIPSSPLQLNLSIFEGPSEDALSGFRDHTNR